MPLSANALESSASGGTQAAQAAVSTVSMKIDNTNAVVQSIISCNASRKFYAPADPKKDANGCVGIGDYQLTMASPNGLNLANGQIAADNSNPSNLWTSYFTSATYGGGYFSGPGIGVYGLSPNGQGVYGASTNNWAGYFEGAAGTGFGVYASGAYGVYGVSTGAGYAGYFNSGASTNGVSIFNNAGNARLCLNGTCVSNVGISCNFSGSRAIYGSAYACQDDLYYTCVGGVVTSMNIGC